MWKTDWGTRWNVWKCKANDNVATRQCDAYQTLEGVWKSIKRPFSMSFSIPPDPLPHFDDGIGREGGRGEGGKEEKKVNRRPFLYTKSTFSLSFPCPQIRSGRRVLCTGPTTKRNNNKPTNNYNERNTFQGQMVNWALTGSTHLLLL